MTGAHWRKVAQISVGAVALVVTAACGSTSSDATASGDDAATATPECVEISQDEFAEGGQLLLHEHAAGNEDGPYQLAVSLPEGWCVVSHLAGGQAFDGAPIAGVRFAGPPDEAAEAYPMVEITGMWNQSLGLDATAVADGMNDTVDGDWTPWAEIPVGETSALFRSNQETNAREELQMVTTMGEWAISIRAYGMEPVDVAGLAEGVQAVAPAA